MYPNLLIVDDEKGLIEMVTQMLVKENFDSPDIALNGTDAIKLVQNNQYDLIILDVMLPDMDGFSLCNKLREYTNVPILFLSARTTDLDKIKGFTMGADDYITKPFNPIELVLRIQAHLRKIEMSKPIQQKKIQFGNVIVNLNEGEVWVRDEKLDIPAKEFALLSFFCQNPNQIFTTRQLYEQIWDSFGIGNDNTVAVHIQRLREKIEENPKQPKHLINIRGLGYKFKYEI